jgi:WD40 repeat protein
LWDFESNKCSKTFSFTCEVTCNKKAPNNKLICGLRDNTINILNIESGECIATINEHFDIVESILPISNGKFVTCSFDNTINCLTKIHKINLKH